MSQYQHSEGADGAGHGKCLALLIREIQIPLGLQRVMAVFQPRALGTTPVTCNRCAFGTLTTCTTGAQRPVRHSGDDKEAQVRVRARVPHIDLDLVQSHCSH